jgi:hypothetical protein
MYEHVGVDEEGMYEVEIVHVHVPSVGVVDKEHINVNDKSEDDGSTKKEESSENEDNSESGTGEKEDSSEDEGNGEN